MSSQVVKPISFLVVVPTFKRGDLLYQTLMSVVAQTYDGWKILISDSGNTVTEGQILSWFPAEGHRIRLLSYGKEIPAFLHWEGLLDPIAEDDSDYFVLLGDDDVWVPGCLEEIVKYNGAGVIACNCATFFEDEKNVSFQYLVGPDSDRFSFEEFVAKCLSNHGCVIENGKMLRSIPDITTHVSAYFIAIKILRQVMQRYGSLWARPFGDVGIGWAVYEAGGILLVYKPLAVIRRHESLGMAFVNRNRRKLADGHSFQFISDFPAVVCFNVFSALSYQKVLISVGRRIVPTAWFYFLCIRQMGSDIFTLSGIFDILRVVFHGVKRPRVWVSFPNAVISVFFRARRSGLKPILLQCNNIQESLVAIAR